MNSRRRALWLFSSVTALASMAVLTALTARSDEPASDSVGTIDGPAVAVTGAMCGRGYRGAVRLEQQLTGQNIVVPQSADVLLVNGQLDGLRAGGERCSCDPQLTKYSRPPRLELVPPTQTSEDANSRPLGSGDVISPLPLDKPAEKEAPVYQFFIPPLIYNANAEVQPEVDTSKIVVVRRVRVRPTLIFQGRVEGELPVSSAPVSAAPTSPAPARSEPQKPIKPAAQANNATSMRSEERR